jgi:hypothetical protein
MEQGHRIRNKIISDELHMYSTKDKLDETRIQKVLRRTIRLLSESESDFFFF